MLREAAFITEPLSPLSYNRQTAHLADPFPARMQRESSQEVGEINIQVLPALRFYETFPNIFTKYQAVVTTWTVTCPHGQPELETNQGETGSRGSLEHPTKRPELGGTL